MLTPPKGPNVLSVENKALRTSVVDLFDVLLDKKIDKSPINGIVDFVNQYDPSDGVGLLHAISNAWAVPMDFNTISLENVSYYELFREEGRSIDLLLGNLSSQPLGQKFKDAIVALVSKKMKIWLKSESQQHITDYCANTHSLADLYKGIKTVNDLITEEAEKTKFLDWLKKGFISNLEIKDQLVSSGAIWEPTGDFHNWPEEVKKGFDAITSRNILNKMENNINYIKKTIDQTKDFFGSAGTGFSVLLDKHPFDRDALVVKFPDFGVRLEELHQQKLANPDQANDLDLEIQKLFLSTYIEDLKTKRPDLGAILEILNQHQFNFGSLSPDQQKTLISSLAQMRFDQLVSLSGGAGITSVFGVDEIDLRRFHHQIYDLDSSLLSLWWIDIPITKTIETIDNPSSQTLDGFIDTKGLPLSFSFSLNNPWFTAEQKTILSEVFKDKLANDGTVTLWQEDSGRLLYLFLAANSWDKLVTKDGEKFKKTLDLWDKEIEAKNKLFSENGDSWNDDPWNDDPWTPSDEKESAEEDALEKFYEAWDKVKGYSFDMSKGSQHGFVPWTQIYLAHEESELPPYSGGAPERLKMEIMEVDLDTKSYKVRFSGTERRYSGSGYIEQERDMKASDISQLLLENEDLIADAVKLPASKWNLESDFQVFRDSGIADFTFWEGREVKNGKFVIDTEITDKEGKTKTESEDVQYFWTLDMNYDGESEKKEEVLYKVEYNSDNTVKVSSEFLNTEKKGIKYEETMSSMDFLMFISSKKLSPKTSQEAEKMQEKLKVKQQNSRKWTFYSISEVVDSIKGLWKGFKSKREEHHKGQVDAFTDWMVSDVGIYKMLWKTLWFLPAGQYAATELEQEHFLKRDAAVWWGIEKWIKILESDPDFWDTFEKKDNPWQHLLWKGVSLADFILSGQTVYNNPALRPLLAATLIAQIKKGKGLYRGLKGKDKQGLWVKCLFGDAYHKVYMQERKNIEERIKAGADDADELQDILVKSEMNFIINNIRGSGGGTWFGSIDGSQTLKGLYSDAYSGALDEAYSGWQSKSKIDDEYNKIKHSNFGLAFVDFKRFASSGRFPSCVANLKKMGDLAKTPEDKRKVKMGLSYLVVSGLLKTYGDIDTRKHVEALARTFTSYPTAIFARKYEGQKIAAHILNKVPIPAGKENFSKATGYTLADFDGSADNVDYKWLMIKMDKRWKENEDKIEEFFDPKSENPIWKADPILRSVREKVNEGGEDNTDPAWMQNDVLISDSPLRAGKSNIKYLGRHKNGEFEGESASDKNTKITFWNNLSKDLNKIADDPDAKEDTLKLVVNRLLTWFDESFWEGDYPRIVEWLKTAKQVKNQYLSGYAFPAVEVPVTDKNNPGPPKKISVPTKGNLTKDSHEEILWYLINGKIFQNEHSQPPAPLIWAINAFKKIFVNHIDKIASDDFIASMFWSQYRHEKPWVFIPWEEYQDNISNTNMYWDYDENNFPEALWNSQWGQIKTYKRRLYSEEDIFLNAQIARMHRSISNKRMNINIPSISSMDDQGKEEIRDRYTPAQAA